jgi:hypothetical protein
MRDQSLKILQRSFMEIVENTRVAPAPGFEVVVYEKGLLFDQAGQVPVYDDYDVNAPRGSCSSGISG